jgi:multidrug efflux pump subunit AcrA (membrane-fusion protein)
MLRCTRWGKIDLPEISRSNAAYDSNMRTTDLRFHSGQRLSGCQLLFSAAAFMACIWPLPLAAQSFRRAKLDQKIIIESGGATQVAEKVRAKAPGVVVEIFVNVGDEVKKDQILGHTELDATKYQLDLARLALEGRGSIDSALGQADAWTANRQETEDAVRRRKVEKSRLEWATGMEQMYRGAYQAQLDKQKIQRVQYEYWQEQYDNRFFKSPVDGVVTEIKAEIGKKVDYATHLFTVGNEESYVLPVTVPEELAGGAVPGSTLPIRSTTGGYVGRGLVQSIISDPKSPGKKIVKLLLDERDVPASTSANLPGMKFDVLLPEPQTSDTTQEDTRKPPTGDPPDAPAPKP